MAVYSPMVDIMGAYHTGKKGLIYFSDGLYGGISQSPSDFPIKFKTLDNHYSSSIFVSLDPIALDSVLFDFLFNEPNQPNPSRGCTDNYLHEGALANNPPSKTKYVPSGKQLNSLGVHEHWNSVEKREYTRNLKIGDGIELVKVHEVSKSKVE